jgi:hypothetical protein
MRIKGYPSQPAPSSNPYRQLRREVRRAGSAFLDATELLQGQDYKVTAQMYALCEWLLRRLATAERRAA